MIKKSALLVGIFVFLCFNNGLFAKSPTIVVTTGEWAPYTTSTTPDKGVISEIVSAAFNEMGEKYEIKFYPWKRAENMVKKGKSFGAFPYAKNPDREVEYLFSDKIGNSTGRFFFLKSKMNKVDWEQLEDLASYKIGGAAGYWYEKKLTNVNPGYQSARSPETNLKKIIAGRIHLTPIDELVGWRLIRDNYPAMQSNFDTLDKPLNQSELYLMISKTYPNSESLLKRFNEALARIHANGTYKEIISKYGLKN